jgi:hypothetical protein
MITHFIVMEERKTVRNGAIVPVARYRGQEEYLKALEKTPKVGDLVKFKYCKEVHDYSVYVVQEIEGDYAKTLKTYTDAVDSHKIKGLTQYWNSWVDAKDIVLLTPEDKEKVKDAIQKYHQETQAQATPSPY